ncbi:Calnexin [Lamellibrachia satsuma]|nr:Calnexin [Lamellibrachia satsuma]
MKSETRYLWVVLLACLLATSMAQSDDILEDGEDDGKVEVEDDSSENEIKTAQAIYKKPIVLGKAHLAEPFDNADDFKEKWVKSEAKKDGVEDNIARYDGEWKLEEPKENALKGDFGIVLKSRAKHHAISRLLDRPYEFISSPLIVQYEVKFQNGQECGGGYIKLLTQTSSLNLKKFTDKTPYTIMFGPDKCGNDNKLHFIFRHKNPVTGQYEEKHAKKPTAGLDTYFSDKKTHLYTLVVDPENTFEVFVDQTLVNSGSLLQDFEPSVNPSKEVVDPTDVKPEDWDEREKIADPEATKPEDWDESEPEMIEDDDASMPDGWLEDEPALVPDPSAERPKDWDDDMDGEWEPPMISNPACESVPGCGQWKRPQTKNPKFKGVWKATMIDNPNYKVS